MPQISHCRVRVLTILPCLRDKLDHYMELSGHGTGHICMNLITVFSFYYIILLPMINLGKSDQVRGLPPPSPRDAVSTLHVSLRTLNLQKYHPLDLYVPEALCCIQSPDTSSKSQSYKQCSGCRLAPVHLEISKSPLATGFTIIFFPSLCLLPLVPVGE